MFRTCKTKVNKVKIKTTKNNSSPSKFLARVADAKLRSDCRKLLSLFKKATGLKPKMWGTSIVGFGEYTYFRSNGDEGKFLATGFSPRKSGPTLYILPGYKNYSNLLKKLGPHKLSKSCLYLKSLENIDLKTLETLIKSGLRDLKKNHDTNY